jgi:glutamate/aspartate transport system substrate-binding protein
MMTLSALFFSLLLPPAMAGSEAQSATIKRLRESGEIVLGYYDGNPPFSWVNQDGKVIGYSVEISDHIITHLAKRLNLPFLATRQVPITLQNRFIMIQNGQIDLECTTTTHTHEREKAVAFSNTIFISRIRLLTRKEGPIREFPDLRGKTVTVIGNTRAQALIEQMSQQLPINVLATHDRDVAPLTILQAGHADAYMNDEAVLYGTLARTWRPKDWLITGSTGGFEAYGCTMAKRDPALKQLVDEAIADLMRSGKAEKLYAKWFMAPIPPVGNNLQFPPSEQMLQLFRNPNDKAFE